MVRSPTKQPSRPRGRPKDPTKRAAILDAARGLFLSTGINVTTDSVAAKAGVAKATLYANFPDKETLMVAVLRHETERMIMVESCEIVRDMPLRDALAGFGVRYLSFINDRNLTRWNSLIAASAAKHPDLPRRLFAAGPGRLQELLAEIIEQGVRRGELALADPAEAAGNLTGLWLGFEGMKISLLARDPYTPAELQSRAKTGVGLFFRLYGTPAHSSDVTDSARTRSAPRKRRRSLT